MRENDKYFEPEAAIQLTQIRDEMRGKNTNHRLTYDCMKAMVKDKIKVVCKLGYSLGGKNKETISLLSVLRGRSSRICQPCADYDGETDEG